METTPLFYRLMNSTIAKGNTMKKLIALACMGLMFTAPAFAGAQQEKMKSCNKEAKEKTLKGDERKKFMSGCLKG